MRKKNRKKMEKKAVKAYGDGYEAGREGAAQSILAHLWEEQIKEGHPEYGTYLKAIALTVGRHEVSIDWNAGKSVTGDAYDALPYVSWYEIKANREAISPNTCDG